MRIEDRRQEFLFALGRVCYAPAILETEQQLSRYLDGIEDLGDSEVQEACKVQIARRGLELEQKLIPQLQELARKILDASGGAAVRLACAPIERNSTNPEGKPIPPLDSGLTVPTRFKSALGRAVDALAG